MCKVGIVSASWVAFAHRPAWEVVEGVKVTAIARRAVPRLQRTLDLKRLIDDVVGLVTDWLTAC